MKERPNPGTQEPLNECYAQVCHHSDGCGSAFQGVKEHTKCNIPVHFKYLKTATMSCETNTPVLSVAAVPSPPNLPEDSVHPGVLCNPTLPTSALGRAVLRSSSPVNGKEFSSCFPLPQSPYHSSLSVSAPGHPAFLSH